MNIRNLMLDDIGEVVNLWNKNTKKYKPFDNESYIRHVIEHPDFNIEGAFVGVEKGKIIALSIVIIRKIDIENKDAPAYLSTLLVDKNYRRLGLAKQMLDKCEEYAKNNGKNKLKLSYRSTLNYPWYIPNTDKHDHAGAPGVFINSDLYFFLINNNYLVVDEQDAFHLDLTKYQMPDRVKDKILKNKNDGYEIEIYNSSKHYGLDEFYEDINDEGFIRVIKENLAKEKPNPFLVISKNGEILGWTGAMYTEISGRAHFDGIAISSKIRNRGLGQGLWCSLAEYSKQNGSAFMSFFTGRTNHARYIYLKSGFKIIQSFAIMEKEI